MSGLNGNNIKKTIYFLKRNGIRKTFYAVLERCTEKKEDYNYIKPTKETLEEQKKYCFDKSYKFSILVPTFETKEIYLREMIDSVLNQTYGNFELIIADASKSDCVEQVVKTYPDKRILYERLKKNEGISENTNAALKRAQGDYIGLLDHDDLLTEDALFEMAKAIEKGKKDGIEIQLLYSDEDKCDGEGKKFFEPHIKLDFNLDLMLSNNYVCHFMVMKKEMMKGLRFLETYDGAQDYDIMLRCVATLLKGEGYEKTKNELVCHLPKILYHWRCHEESTAVNPRSKMYAYDAGRIAVWHFLDEMLWRAVVRHSRHLGFYEIEEEDTFGELGNIGAIGGKVIDRHNRITGCLWQQGKKPFEGLNVHLGGYMHRASLRQTMDTLDLRCIRVHPKLVGLFEEITGMKYIEKKRSGLFCREKYKKTEEEWDALSRKFCDEVQKRGYRLVFYPQYVYKIRKNESIYKWSENS